MGLIHSPRIVTDGLVLCLDAGNTRSYPGSGTTWTNLSGLGNNGTLTNGPTFSSSNRGSIVFDGVDDYITSSFSTSSGQAVTYEGWLFSTETTGTYRMFLDSNASSPRIQWFVTGTIEFDNGIHRTSSVYRNQWVHVAYSKPSGSSGASFYVNGQFENSGPPYTLSAVTPSWFNRVTADTWAGRCSIIRSYNRALSAAEIRQNFNALRGRFGI
jgi:hypothetical protein